MNEREVLIRPIEPADNKEIATIIRLALEELEVPEKGTTYADKELDQMYESFSVKGASYFVAEEDGKLLGGAGIIHLKDEPEEICELQKMYLTKDARGRGIGSMLLKRCLKSALELGYKNCYLETMSDMIVAQDLYVKNGFKYLKHRMGATGHYVCPVWMIKELSY